MAAFIIYTITYNKCVQELIVLVLKQTLKEDIKENITSSWLIVRLPLVSYVKVTYGSNIIILISNIRVNTLYYI